MSHFVFSVLQKQKEPFRLVDYFASDELGFLSVRKTFLPNLLLPCRPRF